MLWLRGLIFTILFPAVVGVYIPMSLVPRAQRHGGAWDAGWGLLALGTFIYAMCLFRFLAAGGTPAIFFSRPLRFLIGEEPGKLVSQGLYRFSRNPMYVGVLLVIAGQTVVFESQTLAVYAVAVFVCFHLVVVFVEEPHLRATRGPSYDLYCRTTPRWLGLARQARENPADS